MNNAFCNRMLEATRLTSAGRLADATALLQQMLQGGEGAACAPKERAGPIIDGVAETVEATGANFPLGGPTFGGAAKSAGTGPSWAGTEASAAAGAHAAATAPRTAELLRGLFDTSRLGRFQPGGLGARVPDEARADLPDGARFLAATFSNAAGSRPYKLYVPSGYRGQPVPMVVMLHGCTQSADDFAAGTRMNAVAEEQTCLVVYPEQIPAANASKCWNWFSGDDQQRDKGEPSLIAGITRHVMGEYCVDPDRVYVAGLSAGAAAATVMGAVYPDLYAAIGVHSGLAYGAASDMMSGFAAMRQGSGGNGPAKAGFNGAQQRQRIVPAIVFHGDRDTTVHPSNGDAVVAQAMPVTPLTGREREGRVPGGHAYKVVLHADASGKTILEQWVILGAGHAWSGGSPAGSFTDPRGPDASREMLRFFLEHRHSAAGRTS